VTGDEALARQVMADWRAASLPAEERVLLAYAEKLTLRPGEMTKDDIAELRRHGFGDRASLQASHIVGYFNSINRLADALGVDLEPEMPPDPRGTP
jgi:uncharacterized peroxidase-related enzyme